MLRVTSPGTKGQKGRGNVPTPNGKPSRQVRFPGITKDAQRLGVRREHLWMVLNGDRKSASLLKRYQKLKRAA